MTNPENADIVGTGCRTAARFFGKGVCVMESCFLAVDKRYFALCRREELHLKSQDILILAQIEEFWRNGRPCWLTNRTLAENIGESESTVKRALDRLCALGVISRETTAARTAKQRLLHFCAEKVQALAGPPVEPPRDTVPAHDTQAPPPAPDAVPQHGLRGMNPPQDTAPGEDPRAPDPLPDTASGGSMWTLPPTAAPNRDTPGSYPAGERCITAEPPVQDEPTKDNLQDNPKEKPNFSELFANNVNVPFYAKRLLKTLEAKQEQEAGEDDPKREYGLPSFGRIL